MYPSQTDFLDNVKNHSLEIKRNDGISRHLTFSNNGSNLCQFSLITEPGILIITGDCGTFVFSRIKDMFAFFVDDRSSLTNLNINPSYWSEKVIDGNERCYEYDAKKTRTHIEEILIESEWEPHLIKETLEELTFEDGDIRLVDSIMANDDLGYDFVESIVTSPTSQYLWCCYAIVWGILKFREHQTAENCQLETANSTDEKEVKSE